MTISITGNILMMRAERKAQNRHFTFGSSRSILTSSPGFLTAISGKRKLPEA